MRNKTPYPEIAARPDGKSFRDDVPDGWKELFDSFCARAAEISPETKIAAVREYLGRLLLVPDLKNVPEHLRPEISELALAAWRDSWDHCCSCGKTPELETRGGWRLPFCTECAALRLGERFSPITIKQFHKEPPQLTTP